MKKIIFIVFAVFTNQIYSQIEDGLIVHFPFDSNINDVSSSGITATNYGCTFGTDRNGVANGGLVLGTSNYLAFNDAAIKTDLPVSISVWANFNSFNNFNVIFTSDNEYNDYYGYWVSTNTSGEIVLNFGGGLGSADISNRRSFKTDDVLQTGVWYHIIGIIRSYDDMDVYVDCKHSTGTYTGSGSTTMLYSSSESRIGTDAGNSLNPSGSFFDGIMDQFAIWNRELSIAEMDYLCDSGNYLSVDNEISENSLENLVKIQPNHGTSVNMLFEKVMSPKIAIYDVMGKMLFSNEYILTNSVNIDIEDYTQGTYFIQVNNNTEVKTFKFIKE